VSRLIAAPPAARRRSGSPRRTRAPVRPRAAGSRRAPRAAAAARRRAPSARPSALGEQHRGTQVAVDVEREARLLAQVRRVVVAVARRAEAGAQRVGDRVRPRVAGAARGDRAAQQHRVGVGRVAQHRVDVGGAVAVEQEVA
jgi:hypothetical protein